MLAASGCGAVGRVTEGDTSRGKQLFQQKCASCHTLADAKTTGAVGPNLDDAFACAEHQGFKRSTIRDVVRGQIDYASPPMPRELVKGQQADDVADYIATVAGQGVDCTTDAQPKTNGQ